MLRDALPDYAIRERPKAILHGEAPPEKRVYVYTFGEDQLAKIPEDLKATVRALGKGVYIIEGDRDMLDKLKLRGEPPVAGAAPRSDHNTPLGQARFTIRRSCKGFWELRDFYI